MFVSNAGCNNTIQHLWLIQMSVMVEKAKWIAFHCRTLTKGTTWRASVHVEAKPAIVFPVLLRNPNSPLEPCSHQWRSMVTWLFVTWYLCVYDLWLDDLWLDDLRLDYLCFVLTGPSRMKSFEKCFCLWPSLFVPEVTLLVVLRWPCWLSWGDPVWLTGCQDPLLSN